jgi:hypothetical protein
MNPITRLPCDESLRVKEISYRQEVWAIDSRAKRLASARID